MTSTASSSSTTLAYAAPSANAPLAVQSVPVRACRTDDVRLKVLYCGVCHSDIHQVRDDWYPGIYPLVPGHEIVGTVEEVGSGVSKFRVGERVAVGCMVDSCQSCRHCQADNEHRCSGVVYTYNSKGKDGVPTIGGYAREIVCSENFVCKVPDGFTADELRFVAPLLCAGITVYSPMMRCGANRPGCRIGVMGLGGLGHMAVKFGVAFGNPVTVISRSAAKRDVAIKTLGATAFVDSSDAAAMKQAEGSLDFIIDTIAAVKPLQNYMSLLDVGGCMACVGIGPADVIEMPNMALIMQQKQIVGSLIGGVKETQEMLDFCAEKKILPMCEVIHAEQINEAFERVVKSDVQFRFVISHEDSRWE